MITIKSSNIELQADLLDGPTAKAIKQILPIKAKAQVWGDEIYFKIPTHIELDNTAKEIVNKGDLGFWPQGDCFCIFFGPTPMSKGNEIRPASAVNIFGKVKGDLARLKHIKDGDTISIV
ncbi:MAG: hypothetical protein KJ601_06665 [Nanoarchaeota archaeon]|nr:hypothetical protein [Nanoarchaeota archaeon]MBU1704675.1 hypothetical protein [Nanoarchaeota archaeon]